jgi:hypothetical protein
VIEILSPDPANDGSGLAHLLEEIMKDVITDLCDRMDVLRLRYGVVFRDLTPAAPPFIPIAKQLAAGLREENAGAAQIVAALIDPAELTGSHCAEFWATPLGILFFVAGGYPSQAVPQTTVAALLGKSRQWVNLQLQTGRLSWAAVGGPAAVDAHDARRLVRNALDRIVK